MLCASAKSLHAEREALLKKAVAAKEAILNHFLVCDPTDLSGRKLEEDAKNLEKQAKNKADQFANCCFR